MNFNKQKRLAKKVKELAGDELIKAFEHNQKEAIRCLETNDIIKNELYRKGVWTNA